MKNILITFLFLAIIINCKAQSPVINIEDYNGKPIEGAYYRDTDNLLDSFVGTYIYTNGTTSLKIVLQKKTMLFDSFKYEDLLVGEYQYLEDGVEKINTLINLAESHLYSFDYGIHGNAILRMNNHMCFGCTQNEVRIRASLVEHSTGNISQIIVSKVIENDQPAMKINVWWRMGYYNSDYESLPLQPSFPSGDYVLIKQP